MKDARGNCEGKPKFLMHGHNLKHDTYQKRGTVTLVSNGTEGTEIFSVEERFLLIYVLEFWISGILFFILFYFLFFFTKDRISGSLGSA